MKSCNLGGCRGLLPEEGWLEGQSFEVQNALAL